MKTTLDIPDDLMREVKIRAAEENKKLKDVVAELLRKGLAEPDVVEAREEKRNRVQFPLFKGEHPAKPGEEITPEKLAELLLEQDVNDLVR